MFTIHNLDLLLAPYTALYVYILFVCLQEYEKKMVPWLYCFAVFTLFRLFVFIFGSIVNDMIFGYNIVMCLLWIIYTVASVYGWLLVYSLYLELSDLTKLEDLAHLRVSRSLLYVILVKRQQFIYLLCIFFVDLLNL